MDGYLQVGLLGLVLEDENVFFRVVGLDQGIFGQYKQLDGS